MGTPEVSMQAKRRQKQEDWVKVVLEEGRERGRGR
jgi:16S rRNA U516 pseudouridylate synthase RsuA-like enzyme